MVIFESCNVWECMVGSSRREEEDEIDVIPVQTVVKAKPNYHNPLADEIVQEATERAKNNTQKQQQQAKHDDNDDDDCLLEKRMMAASASKRNDPGQRQRCQTPIPSSGPSTLTVRQKTTRRKMIQPRRNPRRAPIKNNDNNSNGLKAIGEDKVLKNDKKILPKWRNTKQNNSFVPDAY